MRVGNKNTIDQIRKNRTEIEIKLTRYMALYAAIYQEILQ